MNGRTEYSGLLAGSRGNYGWPVRFDLSDGSLLGITQLDESGNVKDRVLLSPKQVRALLDFIGQKRRRSALTA